MKQPALAAAVSAIVLALAPAAGAGAKVFLITDLALRDPHTFTSIPFLGCTDVTDHVPLGLAPSFNEGLGGALSDDDDGDGFLDLSPIVAFLGEEDEIATGWGTPGGEFQVDPADSGGELALHLAACTAPVETSECHQDEDFPVQYALYTNAVAGTCLAPDAGSLGGYTPAVLVPAAPCFASDPFVLSLDLPAAHLDLEEARIGATWEGIPPSGLVDGLLGGFLSEAAADTTLFAADVPLVGGAPLSSVLPGGAGCCAPQDDRDLGPDGQTTGWWIYFNFQAVEVTLIPTATPEGPAAGAPGTHADGFRLEAGRPNPFRTAAAFSCSIPRAGAVRLRVVDVCGRLVTTLVDGRHAAGTFAATWNGRTRDGSPAAPGIYFVRLEWCGRALTERLVRLR